MAVFPRESALNRMGEMILAVTDLVEAEGRALRDGAQRMGWSLALIGLAALFGGAGVGLCLWALHLFLSALIGTTSATLVIGILSLIVAGGFAWGANRTRR